MRVCFRCQPIPRCLRNRMSLCAGFSQSRFVGRDGIIRIAFQLSSRVEIVCNAVTTFFNDRRNPRQGDPRHDEVENAKDERQPNELRREGGKI